MHKTYLNPLSAPHLNRLHGAAPLKTGQSFQHSPAKKLFSRYIAALCLTALAAILVSGKALAQAPNISYPANVALPVNIAITPLTPTNTGGAVPANIYGQVTTLAGTGAAGSANSIITAASFFVPAGVATDALGNVYVADEANNLIRKISPAGVVTTLAGSGARGSADGIGIAASFYGPVGVATDASGNVYVADTFNNLIRKVSPAGVVSTLAGSGSPGSANGMATAASFYHPFGVATDASGNLYVADCNNNLIRKISPLGAVTTLAGSGAYISTDGTGTAASFYGPVGVATDALGNVYVADYNGLVIRKISTTGVVTTLAGSGAPGSANGNGRAASFFCPSGVATDASGNIYVADNNNNLIRKISPSGVVTTLAGSGAAGSANGIGIAASFNQPGSVSTDASGNVYVADANNNQIRKITPAGVVTTLAGSGAAGSVNTTFTSASFNNPTGVATDAPGNVYVADAGNNLIRKVSPAGVVSTLAGSGTQGSINGQGPTASFYQPTGVATDASGNVYVADELNNLIRTITPGGTVATLNCTGTAASFSSPFGVATDASGNVYVADEGNASIKKVIPSGVVSILAPVGAVAGGPTGIATDALGNVYEVDPALQQIGKISPSGVMSILAGSGMQGSANGPPATFYRPLGVATDALGNVYVADTYNNMIRKISPAGVVTTLAGSVSPGSANGTGTAASFAGPAGVAADAFGNVYVADGENNLIRKITVTGYSISPVLPTGLSFDATTGTITGTPTALSASAAYTVTAYNLLGSSSATFNIAVVPNLPTLQAQDVTFSNTTSASTTVSWVNGNGTARAVFIEVGNSGGAQPTNNTTYTANTAFGSGTQIGTGGWYCIYNGTGSSVAITNLTAGTTYRVTVVEYNGAPGEESYLETGLSPASVTTVAITPTTPARALVFNNTTYTGTTLSWTNGSGMDRAVFIEQGSNGGTFPVNGTSYNANMTFGSGDPVVGTSPVWYCIYNGNGTNVTITGLTPGLPYRATVIEYNTIGGEQYYLTTGQSPATVTTLMETPTIQASNVMLSVPDGNNTSTATWTNGNGNYRVAFLHVGGGVTAQPVNSMTSYSMDSDFGDQTVSTEIGTTGWFCVYNGTGSSVNITGLTPSTPTKTYLLNVFEYNVINGEYMYLGVPGKNSMSYSSLYLGGNEYTPLVTSLSLKAEANNILSPNGDGVNDTWIVKNIELYPNNTVTVYNRNGSVVFTKKGYANDWGGTYRGSVLNADTYYYLVDLGNGTSLKGFITVVRD